jgi:TPR repeat protein
MTIPGDSPYRDVAFQVSRGWPVTALQQAESGDVHAQLYLAENAFSRGRTSESVRWYEAAANQGNLFAMLNLYRIHECFESNLPRACHWMEKIVTMYEDADNSDEQNDAIRDVMHSYGWYLLGAETPDSATRKCGLPEEMLDAEEGLRWLETAGDLGHMDAASQLGNLYMTGQHPKVGTNHLKGMEWFKKAAEMGNGHCAFQLAMVYKCGIVPVNRSLEKRWLKVADRLGYAEARAALAGMDSPISSEEAEKRLRHINKEKSIEQYLTTNETDRCSNPTCDRREADGEKFATCALCRSVKYCCRKCQKAHRHAGHKSECKKLQKAKEELKEMNRNNLRPLVDRCYVCSKKEENAGSLLVCGRCKIPKYCSKECQTKHWKSGGHMAECDRTVAELQKTKRLLANK